MGLSAKSMFSGMVLPAFSADRFISCRETLRLVRRDQRFFLLLLRVSCTKLRRCFRRARSALAASNADPTSARNYLHLAGIERVMATLAPNVPRSTGSFSSYTTPMAEWNTSCHRSVAPRRLAHSRSADTIGRTRPTSYGIWSKPWPDPFGASHPEVQTVRAVLGSIRLPTEVSSSTVKEDRTSSCMLTICPPERAGKTERAVTVCQRYVNGSSNSFFPKRTDNWVGSLADWSWFPGNVLFLSCERLELFCFRNRQFPINRHLAEGLSPRKATSSRGWDGSCF